MSIFMGSSLQIQCVECKHVYDASHQVLTTDAISAPGECIAFQSQLQNLHLQNVHDIAWQTMHDINFGC